MNNSSEKPLVPLKVFPKKSMGDVIKILREQHNMDVCGYDIIDLTSAAWFLLNEIAELKKKMEDIKKSKMTED
jgi:hypothetical protein